MQKNFLHFFFKTYRPSRENNPLLTIVENGDLAQLREFLSAPTHTLASPYSYLHSVDNLNRSLCHHAVLHNQPEILEYLIELGVSCDHLDFNHQTPYDIARLMDFDLCLEKLEGVSENSNNLDTTNLKSKNISRLL